MPPITCGVQLQFSTPEMGWKFWQKLGSIDGEDNWWQQSLSLCHCVYLCSGWWGRIWSHVICNIYIRSLMRDARYSEILLSQNHLVLWPLEIASNLGTMALFKYIFESETVYMIIAKDMGIHSIQNYDITDDMTGNRFNKSPPCTMMLLEERKVGLAAVRAVFLTDPMKIWFTAIMFSNISLVIYWAMPHTSFIYIYILLCNVINWQNNSNQCIWVQFIYRSKWFRERFTQRKINVSSPSSPYSDSIQEAIIATDTSMCYAVGYACIYSSCALLNFSLHTILWLGTKLHSS